MRSPLKNWHDLRFCWRGGRSRPFLNFGGKPETRLKARRRRRVFSFCTHHGRRGHRLRDSAQQGRFVAWPRSPSLTPAQVGMARHRGIDIITNESPTARHRQSPFLVRFSALTHPQVACGVRPKGARHRRGCKDPGDRQYPPSGPSNGSSVAPSAIQTSSTSNQSSSMPPSSMQREP